MLSEENTNITEPLVTEDGAISATEPFSGDSAEVGSNNISVTDKQPDASLAPNINDTSESSDAVMAEIKKFILDESKTVSYFKPKDGVELLLAKIPYQTKTGTVLFSSKGRREEEAYSGLVKSGVILNNNIYDFTAYDAGVKAIRDENLRSFFSRTSAGVDLEFREAVRTRLMNLSKTMTPARQKTIEKIAAQEAENYVAMGHEPKAEFFLPEISDTNFVEYLTAPKKAVSDFVNRLSQDAIEDYAEKYSIFTNAVKIYRARVRRLSERDRRTIKVNAVLRKAREESEIRSVHAVVEGKNKRLAPGIHTDYPDFSIDGIPVTVKLDTNLIADMEEGFNLPDCMSIIRPKLKSSISEVPKSMQKMFYLKRVDIDDILVIKNGKDILYDKDDPV